MAERREVEPGERFILEHTLKGGSDRVYRNYFAADLATEDGLVCLSLMEQGLMVKGRRLSDNIEFFYFHATQAGAEAVGLHLPHER